MRLEEFDGNSAAEQRVKGLKADAKSAEDRAKQLKSQADIDANRLNLKKTRANLIQSQHSSAVSNIKPFGPT